MKKYCKKCGVVLTLKNKKFDRRCCVECHRKTYAPKGKKCKKCFVALDERNRYRKRLWCKTCWPTEKKTCKKCHVVLAAWNAAPGGRHRCKKCYSKGNMLTQKKRREHLHFRLWENLHKRWSSEYLDHPVSFVGEGWPRLTPEMVRIMLKAWDHKSITGEAGELTLHVLFEYKGFSPYGVAPFTIEEMREENPCPLPQSRIADPKVKKKFLLIADVCCGKKPESAIFRK